MKPIFFACIALICLSGLVISAPAPTVVLTGAALPTLSLASGSLGPTLAVVGAGKLGLAAFLAAAAQD